MGRPPKLVRTEARSKFSLELRDSYREKLALLSMEDGLSGAELIHKGIDTLFEKMQTESMAKGNALDLIGIRALVTNCSVQDYSDVIKHSQLLFLHVVDFASFATHHDHLRHLIKRLRTGVLDTIIAFTLTRNDEGEWGFDDRNRYFIEAIVKVVEFGLDLWGGGGSAVTVLTIKSPHILPTFAIIGDEEAVLSPFVEGGPGFWPSSAGMHPFAFAWRSEGGNYVYESTKGIFEKFRLDSRVEGGVCNLIASYQGRSFD